MIEKSNNKKKPNFIGKTITEIIEIVDDLINNPELKLNIVNYQFERKNKINEFLVYRMARSANK